VRIVFFYFIPQICNNIIFKFNLSKEKILGVFNKFEKAVRQVQNKAEEGLGSAFISYS
jgi:hypothetical protein